MRASEDTREEAVARLRQAYVGGRLGTDTFAARLDEALTAHGRGELHGLTADLPSPPERARWWRRRAPGRPLSLPPAGELAGAALVLGRSRACQLVLDDDTVSRRHAELRVRDGRWMVRDLGSANGTWLNGRRVGDAEVRAGDELRLGEAVLRL